MDIHSPLRNHVDIHNVNNLSGVFWWKQKKKNDSKIVYSISGSDCDIFSFYHHATMGTNSALYLKSCKNTAENVEELRKNENNFSQRDELIIYINLDLVIVSCPQGKFRLILQKLCEKVQDSEVAMRRGKNCTVSEEEK